MNSEWIGFILNGLLKDERIPDDLKESEIVTMYKKKGDALECGNDRGIKLLETTLKVYERVIDLKGVSEKVYTFTPISLVSDLFQQAGLSYTIYKHQLQQMNLCLAMALQMHLAQLPHQYPVQPTRHQPLSQILLTNMNNVIIIIIIIVPNNS